MGYYGAADLDAMLAEFGIEVKLGNETVKGLLDESDDELLQGEAATFAGRLRAVTVKTGALTGLAEGASVTVDGTSYKVAAVRRLDDGAVTQFYCGTP